MPKLSRRIFLAGGAVGGALASASSQAYWFSRPTRSSTKALVIGSGFGGSVASLRLCEAGIPTVLLERGQAWKYTDENSFPKIADIYGELEDGVLWREPTRLLGGSVGMLQYIIDSGISVGVGACLGGGSKVYGGVLLQPRREIFETALPALNYTQYDRVYYPRVLDRVSGGPIPDDILNSPNYAGMREHIRTATAAGHEVVRSEVGFDWNIIREEIQGKRAAAASKGEYAFGCNSGAKNTLDRNYLRDAARTGKLKIHVLHNVKHIVKKRWGKGYDVHCDMLSDTGRILGEHIIECEHLFMGAGSVHTTRLLLKSQAMGDLPGITSKLGDQWGTNGDLIYARYGLGEVNNEYQAGPACIASFDTNNPIKPTGFMHSPAPVGKSMQLQMGMLVPEVTSKATYSLLRDKMSFNWDKSLDTRSTAALDSTTQDMINVSGGKFTSVAAFGTWHPLGGVAMGSSCDYSGRVFGLENLYVVDGASIPGAVGAANPALTVAANAERMMDQLIPTLV